MKKIAHTLAALVSACSCIANAAPITSLQTTEIEMQALNLINPSGIITMAPGITWSGSGEGVYGYTKRYGFVANGIWQGSPPFANAEGARGTMEFSFAQPVSAVGGLVNYNPEYGIKPVISIYDIDDHLIESTQLSFRTNGVGEFHGFQLDNPDIYSFRLSNSDIALRNLTILASTPLAPVPEPETYAMLLAGLGLMATVARRKRRVH